MQTVFIIVVQIKLVVVGKDNDERQTKLRTAEEWPQPPLKYMYELKNWDSFVA